MVKVGDHITLDFLGVKEDYTIRVFTPRTYNGSIIKREPYELSHFS